MNLTQIIAAGRRRNDDEVEPYHFGQTVYTQWANNAVVEACLRSRSFRDDATSAVCNITLTQATASYTLHDSVVVPRRIILTDGQRKQPLELLTFSEMDHTENRWDTTQQGEPAAAVLDMTGRTIRLYPVPDQAYTMNMLVWRLPVASEELSAGSDIPSILPTWVHKDLEPWLAFEFFSQHDVDVHDPDQANMELAEFTARFGLRPNAFELIKWARDGRRSAYAHFM